MAGTTGEEPGAPGLTLPQWRGLRAVGRTGDWHRTVTALHTAEMASIAVLIEAFANARLAREQHLEARNRLDAARSAGIPIALTPTLAAEAACLQVRADHLITEAEKLLPRCHGSALDSGTTATLMQ